jgi:hypothetical protein
MAPFVIPSCAPFVIDLSPFRPPIRRYDTATSIHKEV